MIGHVKCLDAKNIRFFTMFNTLIALATHFDIIYKSQDLVIFVLTTMTTTDGQNKSLYPFVHARAGNSINFFLSLFASVSSLQLWIREPPGSHWCSSTIALRKSKTNQSGMVSYIAICFLFAELEISLF